MAAKVLIVKVTRKHIKQGEPGNGEGCPIALALKELLTFDRCRVFASWAWYQPIAKGDYKYLRNSRAAKRFVERFDIGKSVKPATFHLKEDVK